MIKIGIVPSIKETYKNQFEASLDLKFKKFFKTINKKNEIDIILDHNKVNNYKMIVISGGNDCRSFPKLKKKDLIRKKLTEEIIRKAIKLDKPILGICYGAQLIAKMYKSKLKYKKHLKAHKIFIKQKENKIKIVKVNSFHTTVIKKLGKDLELIATAEDKTIEAFRHKFNKIICVMWHPERNKKIQDIDIKLIKKLC